MAEGTDVAKGEKEQKYQEIDIRYREGSLRASELAKEVEEDTGTQVEIDPRAKPEYLATVELGSFAGERVLSVKIIAALMNMEFVSPLKNTKIVISEISKSRALCSVVVRAKSYKALITVIADFFKSQEGKISLAEAVMRSFQKFCNHKNASLGARAQASFFDKKENLS